MNKVTSAGLLMYRVRDGEPEVLLVHYGGPFWQDKDIGAWGIPKGQADNGEQALEQLLEVAKREFEEETSFKPEGEMVYLTSVRKDAQKTVEAWMFEGDCDPAQLKSNTCIIEWPPKSGKKLEIPEVDKGDFFTIEDAKIKVIPWQKPIIEVFENMINENK